MKGDDRILFEERLRQLAASLPYPPTPDVRRDVEVELQSRARRSGVWPAAGWALAAILLAAVITVSLVPGARASLRDMVQVGAVRLLFGSGREGPDPSRVAAVEIDFAGETTLLEARERFPEPILLPAYPPDLGPPNLVYMQEQPSPGVVLVWLDEHREVRMALFELTADAVHTKIEPQVIQRTEVGGQPALWTEGPYLIEVQRGGLAERRLVEGHVLIWTQGVLTFRLETDLPLEEARRIAESLRS